MKTKQIITAVVILITGILIGKFAFTNNLDNKEHQHKAKEEHWTCSMHPEIDLPEFGACPKCGMDLIHKTADSEGLSNNEFKMTKNAMALANIETMFVGGTQSILDKEQNMLQLSGKIKTNDRATSMETAHFGGRIESLRYRSVGEYVKKGSLVASVYSPELVTAQNEFIEALNIKNSQPELYKAVRNKLKNWKISENQILQIEQTKKVIINFKMYANVSGYIDEMMVQEGNHINEGSPLFKVSNLGSVWAVFDVYEQDIKHLRIGQKIVITANAYSDKEILAKINFIDPNLNVNTRTVQVRATLKNYGTKLKPGMLLSGDVQLLKNTKNSSETKIEIPKTAVLWTGKRSVVYIKKSKDTPIFELREVILGNATNTNYQIISGIQNGEEVVVNGAFTVDAAAQLQGKNSMMRKMKNEKLKLKSDEGNLERMNVNPKFKKQLDLVFNNYINLKDVFVLSDADKVNAITVKMLHDLKKIKSKSLKNPKAHKIWRSEQVKIKLALESILQEQNIEKQRLAFINLSNALIVIANRFGVSNTVFVQHCPMANDNNGADWLSLEKEIKNPYFGDKMLRCGSLTQEIRQ